MLKIGLTGGIGSGKSTIAKIFSTLGIPVYDADIAAKELMRSDPKIRAQLIARFGEEVYQQGALNRAYLAAIVFNDEAALKDLNDITHPATIQDAENWFQRQQAPYAIKEAALIFESGSEQFLDYVIGVWAPEQVRIQRVLARGGLTEAQIKSRMARQMNEEAKMKRSHFIIDNGGTTPVIPQVMALHEKLLQLAEK